MKDYLQESNFDSYGFNDEFVHPYSSHSNSFSDHPLIKSMFPSPLMAKITDLTPNIVAVYNLKTGRYIFINNSLKPLLGYEPSEWLRKGVKHVTTLVHPEDLPRIMKENKAAVADDSKNREAGESKIVEFEYRVKHADGSYRWLKTYGTVFDRDKTGKILHVINISLDITAIKTSEDKLLQLTSNLEQKIEERTKKLQESEHKYHTLFSTMVEGVIMQDPTGRILAANPSAQKILNLDVKQMENLARENKDQTIFINEDNVVIPTGQLPFRLALLHGEPQNDIRLGFIRDKKTTWLLVNSIPLKDETGQIYAVASSFQDITRQRNLEKQKDEFISIASHELKTPLTTIKSFTEILKMQFGHEEKALHYLDKMNGEIDRLTGLVSELLDVSKIQSGGLNLNKEYIELEPFLKEIAEDIQTTTSQHKIIVRNIPQVKIFMDKHRMYQVLINLISNAIKYSPEANRIILSAAVRDDRVTISIKDFGIGITKRDKKRIFDAFFQATTTIRKSHSGLGLGLHISREIVARHGGVIAVSSKKGVGSTFRFTIPMNSK